MKHRANIDLVLGWLNKAVPEIYERGQENKGDAIYTRPLGKELEEDLCKLAIKLKTRRWQDGQMLKLIESIERDGESNLSPFAKQALCECKRLVR